MAYCEGLNTWTKFWWWNQGTKWPTTVKDVLEKAYGECTTSDYCFQRLPGWTKENKTEILAIDSAGTIYRWKFDSSNPTAHTPWLALHDHQETGAKKVRNRIDNQLIYAVQICLPTKRIYMKHFNLNILYI